MSLSQLTEKQRDVFEYLLEYLRERDHWPTFQEIADHLDAKSTTSVAQLFDRLVQKHFLVRDGHGSYQVHPTKRYLVSREEEPFSIPIKGVITAGKMAEAVEADMGSLSLDSFFKKPEAVFCLRVAGDSMKEAGIRDGDYALMLKTEIFDGDIAAVVYNGETTLKRVYFKDNGLVLVPENRDLEPIRLQPDEAEEVVLLGKYIGKADEKGLHLT